MWTSARRGLVGIVDDRWGMKWSENGICGGVNLDCDSGLEKWERKLRWESVREEKKRAGTLDYVSARHRFVSWWRWREASCLSSGIFDCDCRNCWTKGRVQGSFGVSRISFLRDLFVAARKILWVVSAMRKLGQQGLFVVADCGCLLSCSVLWRCKQKKGKFVDGWRFGLCTFVSCLPVRRCAS